MSDGFVCRRCGVCCQGEGGIVLTDVDLARLAAHLALSEAEFLARHAVPGPRLPSLKAGADGACIFHVEGHGCAVHPARPDVCRAWPYFRGNLEDADSLDMARADCPGIGGAPFAEFRREGLAYLRAHGLVHLEEGGPNALRVGHLLADGPGLAMPEGEDR